MNKQIVAVGGGKGGVGKSIVAANLAIVMAQLGRRVVLVDADLGGANQHTLFGIDRPSVLLEHFIVKKVEALQDTLLDTAQPGLRIICGGMAILGTANPTYAQKMRLIRQIHSLEVDVVILDIGAGVGLHVLDLFNAAEVKLVVLTPQLTSLHNGYGFLKAAIHRRLERMLAPEMRQYIKSSGPEAGEESLKAVLSRLEKHDFDEAARARAVLSRQKLYLVGNMVRTAKEGHVIGAVGKMVKDQLQLETPILGVVRYGDKIQRSVNERRPFMMWAEIESNAHVFRGMAETLIALQTKREGRSRRRFDFEGSQETTADTGRFDRKHPRFPAYHIGALLIAGGQKTTGSLRNVAYGGCLVEFRLPPPEPANGVLTLGPTADGETMSVEVIERHRDGNGLMVGYSFGECDGRTRTAIASLVAASAASTAVRRTSSIPAEA